MDEELPEGEEAGTFLVEHKRVLGGGDERGVRTICCREVE